MDLWRASPDDEATVMVLSYHSLLSYQTRRICCLLIVSLCIFVNHMFGFSPDALIPARAVAIIGAGAVGSSLARRLALRNLPITAVLSSREAPARRLADAVDAPTASTRLDDLPEEVRAVFLCVPDDEIAAVVAELASIVHAWPRTIVAHTSGALPADVLRPIAKKGAAVLSFHPMQTFPEPDHPDGFRGIHIGVEGHEDAVAYGKAVAERIGASPIRLTPTEKTRVHCAASLASNGLTALVAVVQEILGDAGLDGETAMSVVRPLINQTWHNLQSTDPEAALTGPIVRGDAGTIQDHVDALAASLPHLIPLYGALATEQIRVAVRSGRLAPDAAGQVLDVVQEAVDGEESLSSTSDVPVRDA
jgi:predicted short-subunit dehydrogenase-like oxidoreductase (DUF2520 family)